MHADQSPQVNGMYTAHMLVASHLFTRWSRMAVTPRVQWRLTPVSDTQPALNGRSGNRQLDGHYSFP